jgi:AraC-like DNA-binding protein
MNLEKKSVDNTLTYKLTKELLSNKTGEEHFFSYSKSITILFVATGEILINTQTKTWIKENEACYLSPYTFFSFASIKESSTVFILELPLSFLVTSPSLISSKYLDPFINAAGLELIKINSVNKWGISCLSSLNKIIDINETKDKAYEVNILSESLAFFNSLYNEFSKNISGRKHVSKKTLQFAQMLDYINDNLSGVLDVNTLAKKVGISPREANRTFMDFVSMSPMQFIKRKRVLLAGQTLQKEPSIRLSRLAKLCGFCTPSYLIESFKPIYGETPVEYAKRYNITKWSVDPFSALNDYYS